MVTAKQRAWRKKFAARYGKKKKTRRARRVRVVKQKRRPRPMARRRRGRKGRRSKKASVSVAMVAPIAYVAYSSWTDGGGFTPETLAKLVARTTGYYPTTKTFNMDYAKGFWSGELAGIVVHKVANRVGINKSIRRMTGGYLSL